MYFRFISLLKKITTDSDYGFFFILVKPALKGSTDEEVESNNFG